MGPIGLGELTRLPDPADRQLVLRELSFELVGVGDGRGVIADDLTQLVEMREPRRDVDESRVVGEFGLPIAAMKKSNVPRSAG